MAHQHDMHGHSGSHMDPMMHVKTIDQVSKELQRCIKNCTDCHNICRDTATHSLERGGFDAIADHVWMLLDCAEICQTSAHFMMHNSPLHHATCGACAEVCEKCAEGCDRFTGDDMMHACAEMCRRCAESCRSMAHA